MKEYYLCLILLSIFCLCSIIQIFANKIQLKNEKKLLDFTRKFDDYTNAPKITYVFAEEIKFLLKAELVAIVEYSYSKIQILSSVPMTLSDKDLSYSHEIYLILKNLEQENISHIQTKDIRSEHFKELFPLFNFKYYHIFPLYSEQDKIVTLEIYSDEEKVLNSKNKIFCQMLSIFKKIFIQQNNFQKEFLQKKQNEIVIRFLDRIRNTLNQNELEQNILEEITRAFNADRAYFITSNKNNLQNPILGKEYLGNPYAKSLRGNNLDFKAVWQQMMDNKMNPPVFVIEDSEKFIKQNNLQDTPIDIFLQKSQIKSSYPFLVYEDDESLLYLVLQYTKNPVIFDKSDFEIMELITKQTNIAISQAILYAKLIQKNKKENILKEIYADTIRLQSKKQIYSYFSEKIMSLLNAAGIVFVEFPKIQNDKIEYFEHYKSKNINLSKFKNYGFINEIINKRNLSYTCNLRNSDNQEAILFLKETGALCIATLPVTQNLLIVIFFTTQKDINVFDKNILFSLVDVIAKTLKDILKTAELNNLRERFLATLTHDLQIPVIAERNAINFLISKKNNWDDNTKELLNDLQETNKQMDDMLRALTSIYKYETNRKELTRENCNILDIIDFAISKFLKIIEKNGITIKKEINTENLNFFGDHIEISKVIIIFLMNALDDSENEAEILFQVTDKGKYLKCCITSSGKNNNIHLGRMIFDRNITSNNLEYRVGEEIYFYLAKLIVNAHQGKIYINNTQTNGHIFCLELEKII